MCKLLKAGIARADITPHVGTILMGYSPRISTNIHDRLTATVLLLEYEDVKTALISITTTVIDDEEVSRIRKLVSVESGLHPLNITVASCQIHSGPATQTCYGWGNRDDEYCQGILEPGIIQAYREAEKVMKPVRIGIATTHSEVGINRRKILEDGTIELGQNPWGPYDPTMTIIRFMSDNSPLANIIHYGAHPTSIGSTGDITRDWPGIMIDRVEQIAGGITMFLNGAVGDVGPRLSNGLTTGDLNQMYEVGNRAAFDAITAYRKIKEYRNMDLELKKGRFFLPYRPLPPLEIALEKLKAAEGEKDIPGLKMTEYSYWERVIKEYENNEIKNGKWQDQTITRIGPIVMVPFSGEPFAEIVLRLREYSPFQYTLCLSTTNGSDGYIPTLDSISRGGYEVDVAKAFSAYILAEDIDDVLIKRNLEILRSK
jgi:neutral ceramidase